MTFAPSWSPTVSFFLSFIHSFFLVVLLSLLCLCRLSSSLHLGLPPLVQSLFAFLPPHPAFALYCLPISISLRCSKDGFAETTVRIGFPPPLLRPSSASALSLRSICSVSLPPHAFPRAAGCLGFHSYMVFVAVSTIVYVRFCNALPIESCDGALVPFFSPPPLRGKLVVV